MNKAIILTGLDDAAVESEAEAMFGAGIAYLFENAEAYRRGRLPEFAGYKSPTGLIIPKNIEAHWLTDAMLEPLREMGRPSTALVQCVVSHLIPWQEIFIQKIRTGKSAKLAWEETFREITN